MTFEIVRVQNAVKAKGLRGFALQAHITEHAILRALAGLKLNRSTAYCLGVALEDFEKNTAASASSTASAA